MRSLIYALQFLTRLPTPTLADPAPDMLTKSAVWFPLVGMVIGSAITLALWLGTQIDPWLGALLALLCWVWVTGGIHIDGLADLADALGAAHRDPVQLLAIMRDPHTGSFGVLAISMLLASKLVLLMLLARNPNLIWAIILAPTWARLGTIIWSQTLPKLGSGLGQSFARQSRPLLITLWTITLLGASWLVSPPLLFAPLALFGWWLFLKYKLNGMNGDCLGAGVEVVETTLLFVLIITQHIFLQ